MGYVTDLNSKKHQQLPEKHRKAISAIGLDPSGNRMFTAGYDHYFKHWDKGVLFREDEEPFGSYPLRTISFTRHGDKALIVPRSPQPAIITREGRILFEFPRGDPYLLDKRKTPGHSGAMCGGQWHPNISDCFVTGSTDGTIRIWDVTSKSSASVITTGLKNQLSAISWLSDGSGIVSGSTTGMIQLWVNGRKQTSFSISQPTMITSIALSKDKKVAIRSNDGFLRLWDLRKFTSKDCIASVSMLPTAFEEIDILYSPDETVILTGTSELRGGSGYLKAFDATSFEPKGEYETQSGVVRIVWNDKHLVYGLSDGSINVSSDTFTLPSTNFSAKSSLFSSNSNSSKDLTYADIDINAGVYTPEAQNLFDDDIIDLGPIPTRKKPDPVATKRPELPPECGPGRGGKIGSSISQHILQNLVQNRFRDEDPREALLKYAKIAEEDPHFVAPAYKKTQPKPIFSKAPSQDNHGHK